MTGKKSLDQLRYHARAARFSRGTCPAIDSRRRRRRQLGFGQVMIGDDDIDAKLRAVPDYFTGANLPVSTLIISFTPFDAASSTTSLRMP
jgi:hypothetical protein